MFHPFDTPLLRGNYTKKSNHIFAGFYNLNQTLSNSLKVGYKSHCKIFICERIFVR